MAENPTQLDFGQVIPASYDETNKALRVNVVAEIAGLSTTAINDGTTPSILATVLGPNIAPTTNNTALVVSISPNTPISVTTTVETEGQYNTVLPTITNGNSGPIQVDSNARLLVSSIANALPAGTNNLGSLTNITGTISLPTGASTSANQVTSQTTLSSIATSVSTLNAKSGGSLVPLAFDSQSISYVASGNGAGQIYQVLYYSGGLSGTLVKTVTLSYDGSNRLISSVAT
jgi:hypothetical protein